jgi:pimeloyl-ACP methyl ester carboxylesterase
VVAGCGRSSSTEPAHGTTSALDPFTALTVPAPSLRGNLVGGPAELTVMARLPKGYQTSGKRYRSLYFLVGWGNAAEEARSYFVDGAALEDLIIVTVEGGNPLGGSFYRNSPVIGDWESAMAKDLVAYIDHRYRTVPHAAARGIAGHSMGGYGALNLALVHPDVFGALGALAPGVVTDKGLVTTQMFNQEFTIRDELETLAKLEAMPDSEARAAFVSTVRAAIPDTMFALAYGAAVAADPTSRTMMRFPYTRSNGRLVQDKAVMAAWDDGFGNWQAKVAAHRDGLSGLRGIQVEYGKHDEYSWIIDGCRYLDRVLADARIRHLTVEFEGTHEAQVSERLCTSLVPFFAKVLTA